MPIPPADKRPYQPNVVHYTTLVDENGLVYKAQNIVNQIEGDFDPAGLATEEKQDAQTAALGEVVTALGQTLSVVSENDEFPLPAGAATDTKQDAIIAALGTLAGLLGNPLTVSINGEPLEVDVTSLPLATGAATAANQATGNQRLVDILTALGGPLSVTGSVDLSDGASVDVSGSVSLTNSSISVTPSGTFNVSVIGGSTSAKQDDILAALGTLLTAIQGPQPITDNGSSITVDGNVGISGTVATTQSGTWNVGVTGTPNVTVGNASIPVTQSGSWIIQTNPSASATSGALTTFRSGAVNSTPTQVKATSGRVYQYTIMNPNATTAYANLWDSLPGSVTLGTTVPKMSLPIPAGSTLDGYWSMSHGYATAISVSGSANWDGTGALTTGLQMTLGYA